MYNGRNFKGYKVGDRVRTRYVIWDKDRYLNGEEPTDRVGCIKEMDNFGAIVDFGNGETEPVTFYEMQLEEALFE